MKIKSYVDKVFIENIDYFFSNIDTSISSLDVGWRDDSENIKKSISKICGLRLCYIPPAIFILKNIKNFVRQKKYYQKEKETKETKQADITL